MNDQFKGPSAWEDYLCALEEAALTIKAIGVTEYDVTETFQRVLEDKQVGRLQSVSLIFPNVELRLDVGTKGGFVNMHLLDSPEEANAALSLGLYPSGRCRTENA